MIKVLRVIVVLLAVVLLSSCYKDLGNNPVGNQAPKTGLFLYPDSTISRQPSKINVHWWGDDPDGFVIGFYYTWDGTNWHFTESNDSLFALQIGISDTTYTFEVSAVDNSGNGVYDSDVYQNGIHYGPEPFTDKNSNGKWDEGESFVDIGAIDPNPAKLDFPIKNSAPTIEWSKLSVLPDTSFPAMSFGWNANDIDGNESIQTINVALNDTTKAISLNGSVRSITIKTNDFNSSSPMMDILIDGVETNIMNKVLPGLKYNADNKFYVQAVDISGAKSKFITLPDSTGKWYVKKPKGQLLIINDYATADNTKGFYSAQFDKLGLKDKYDFYNLRSDPPPYLTVTFLQTIKLFKYIYWYSDNTSFN